MAFLNVLIVDDDPLAGELLRTALERVARVRIVGEVGEMGAAEVALARNDYDVVFLDVQLNGGSGFDLVPFVSPDAAIIFITGRDDHAVRAFEVNALDYIVKPVKAERLAEALRRLGHASVRKQARRRFKTEDSIFLRGAAAGGRFAPIRDIVAILSSENYSEVALAQGQRWFVRRTMEAWEQLLPPDTFMRVHRTAIANLEAAVRLERTPRETTLLFVRGLRRGIPVSRQCWPHLRVRFAAPA